MSPERMVRFVNSHGSKMLLLLASENFVLSLRSVSISFMVLMSVAVVFESPAVYLTVGVSVVVTFVSMSVTLSMSEDHLSSLANEP